MNILVAVGGPHPCPGAPAGTKALEAAIREVLGRQLARWCVPDEVVYVSEIPHTATGKISKLTLRKMFDGYKLQQQQQPPRSRL